MARLTEADKRTIRRALCDAMDERMSYADAYSMRGPEAEEAIALARSYEALHVKMFGEPSHRQRELDRLAATPMVSIFDIDFARAETGGGGDG